MMGRFRRLLNDTKLREINLLGRWYTWSYERAAPTLVHLDRVFSDLNWAAIFPDHILHSTAAGISDHCPLLLTMCGLPRSRRRFYFENFWPTIDGYQEVVQQAWATARHVACPLEHLNAKMVATAKALQSCSAKRVGNVTEQLDLARELLHQLDIAQDNRPLSTDETWLRRQLKQRSLSLASLQRTIAWTRSRLD